MIVAAVAGILVRQSRQQSARLEADIAALQKEVESLRSDVNALVADSERSAVLSFSEGGYFPVRTNGGTLLVAVANVESIDNSLRVHLRVGNPNSMTYLGFTLGFAWNLGRGQQKFPNVLEPGTWTVAQVTLSPADAASTKWLRITSASVDEIPAR